MKKIYAFNNFSIYFRTNGNEYIDLSSDSEFKFHMFESNFSGTKDFEWYHVACPVVDDNYFLWWSSRLRRSNVRRSGAVIKR